MERGLEEEEWEEEEWEEDEEEIGREGGGGFFCSCPKSGETAAVRRPGIVLVSPSQAHSLVV